MAELVIPLKVNYPVNGTPNLETVANALLGLNKISNKLPHLIGYVFPDTAIQYVSINVDEIKAGSLLTEFILKLVGEGQQDLENLIKRVGTKTGIETLEQHSRAIAILLIIIALAGAEYAYKKVWKEDPSKIINIYNIHINSVSDITGIPKQEVLRRVLRAIGDGHDVAEGAVAFIAPAKLTPGTSIEVNGEILVPSEVVRESPDPAVLAETSPEQSFQPYENVELEIRATDKDQSGRGWSAIVPNISPNRIKVIVGPNIDLAELAKHDRISGNITLVEELKADGTLVPKRIHLLDVFFPRPDFRPKP